MKGISIRMIVVIVVSSVTLLSAIRMDVGAEMTPYQAEETARLIAVLFSTGRVVIDRNQALIDDPKKASKRFTPEVFQRQVIEEYKQRTGVDLTKPALLHLPSQVTELLHALLEASKAVVAEAQPDIDRSGVGFKNFIPAIFGSRVANRFSSSSGIQLKQTTLAPRNPHNAPDSYEEAVLRRLLMEPSQSITISNMEPSNKNLRVMSPIYYTRDCLACHGRPAGEMDISGYPKEGAEEGDLAGAISVSIPLELVR